MLAVDLRITDLTAPAEAVMGETVPISFTIKNFGDTATTGPWEDYLFLSKDEQGDFFFDTTLAVRERDTPPTALAAGESQNVTLQVFLAGTPALVGEVFIVASSDLFNEVAESDEWNNELSRPISLSAPDLELSGAVAPASGSLGEALQVSYHVANLSSVTAVANWFDQVYLSADDLWDFNDTPVSFVVPPKQPLLGGESYDISDQFFVPETVSGSNYILFVSDAFNRQTETREDNNVQALPIQVAGPDLVVQSAVVPAEADPGSTIDISYTVKNQGNRTAESDWTDVVFLSEHPDESFGDIELLTTPIVVQSPLGADGVYTINAQVTLPAGLRGLQYLKIMTDQLLEQGETADANNLLVKAIDLGDQTSPSRRFRSPARSS